MGDWLVSGRSSGSTGSQGTGEERVEKEDYKRIDPGNQQTTSYQES